MNRPNLQYQPDPEYRPVAVELPWYRGLTRYHWVVLVVTSLGLMFDLMDATLFGLAMGPALRELLGREASTVGVGWYGGIITTIFLVGWSLGGMVFGIFADYYGRKATLMLTILVYSLFTGLAAISNSWWELAIYRFITGLGVGGEWGAGTALLAETWPERSRVKAAIILQGASSVGFLVASFANLVVGGFGWRYVFLVGALPGLLLLMIRSSIKESDRWLVAHEEAKKDRKGEKSRFTLKQVLSGRLRRDTIVGTSLATVAAFGYWAVGWFIPTMISELLTEGSQNLTPATIARYTSFAGMLIAFGSLVSYAVLLVLPTTWKRKTTFLFYFAGGFITTLCVLLVPQSVNAMLLLLPLMGFFILGIWVIFPIYLPELYPTHLRATGSGFCFTFGRAVSAVGPTLTGILIVSTGSFVTAMTFLTFVYLLGPITLLFARETRGEPIR